MGKLFTLKKWLTLPAAAKHLSTVFEEEVTQADILRLALDKRLVLSVNFVNTAYGWPGRKVPLSEAKLSRGPTMGNITLPDCISGLWFSYSGIVQFNEAVSRLKGVWDLPMLGSEQCDVKRKYQELIEGHEYDALPSDDVIVEGEAGQFWRILKRVANDKLIGQPYDHPDNYQPAYSLPEDSVFVVRTDALRELEQSLNSEPKVKTKSAQTKERRTLLTIIAALCKPAKVDYKKSDAVQTIQRMLNDVGISLDDKTIRDALNEIDDALEARMK